MWQAVLDPAISGHEAAKRLQHGVGGGLIAHRPLLAEARDREVDHARVVSRHLGIAEAEPVHYTDTKILNENVGAFRELAQNARTVRMFQSSATLRLPRFVATAMDVTRSVPEVILRDQSPSRGSTFITSAP